MSDVKNDPKANPGPKGNAAPEESESMRRLQRDADKMAEAGRDEEESYDADHGEFNKM